MSGLDNLWSQAQLAAAFRVITIIVLTLVALIAAFCLGLVVHHAFSSRRRNRRGRLVRQAIPYLAAHIGAGEPLGAAVREARRRYGDWATAVVLREARRELRGARAAEISAALLEMGEVRRLRLVAHSRADWKRAQAVRELGQCGGDEARAELIEAAQDAAPEVRRAARDGLLLDGRPESVQAAMRSFLRDAPTRTTWKRSFYAHLASAAARELRELLASGALAGSEEKLGLEALGDARDPEAVPLARERLSSPDPEIRATAARVVGKLERCRERSRAVSLLRDSEWFVRAAAARAFESLRADGAAISALGESLADESWWVRSNATRALASQGEPGAEVLLAAADGLDVFSRDAALAALSRVPPGPGGQEPLRPDRDQHHESRHPLSAHGSALGGSALVTASQFINGTEAVIIVYFIALNSIYTVFTVMAFFELLAYRRRLWRGSLRTLLSESTYRPVSLLVPAHNERETLIATIRSLLALRLPRVRGRGDQRRVRRRHPGPGAGGLLPVSGPLRDPRAAQDQAASEPTYRSHDHPNLVVIDKEQGGKSDSLNAGINACSFPLFCSHGRRFAPGVRRPPSGGAGVRRGRAGRGGGRHHPGAERLHGGATPG